MPDSGQITTIVGERRANPGGKVDRRVARTRSALLEAFIALVLDRPYRSITIAEIADRANVGRSTFYEHFGGKDEILLASMGWMFAILAEAADAERERARLDNLVAHFWANRKLARVVLAPPVELKLRRALAAAIENRLVAGGTRAAEPTARRIAAVSIAAGQLGLLGAWTSGELTASAAQIADAVIAIARQQGPAAA